MNEQMLSDSIELVSRLVDRGEYADALTVMAPWADAGLPDLQKTVIAHNVAHIYVSMQRHVEALAWFDWGLPFERSLRRTLLAETKAGLLSRLGRADEAAAILQALLAEDWADAEGRSRIEAALRAARGG
jgi:tetratricopeptide (TPR) repeat protein